MVTAAVQCDLSGSAEGDDVQVGEDPEQQLLGQPPVDEGGVIVLAEHPRDLPLAHAHVDRVPVVAVAGPAAIPAQYNQNVNGFYFLHSRLYPLSFPHR